eukprot:12076109-Prorocentrum_lima.AAC.1
MDHQRPPPDQVQGPVHGQVPHSTRTRWTSLWATSASTSSRTRWTSSWATSTRTSSWGKCVDFMDQDKQDFHLKDMIRGSSPGP